MSGLVLESTELAAEGRTAFASVRGTYFGLFTESEKGTSSSAGGFTFAVTSGGSLSGVWQMEAERLRVSGRLGADGRFTRTLSRAHLNPVTLTLQLDATGGTPLVTGSVSDGVWTAVLAGHRAVFDGARNPAPQAGRYTMLVPGDCVTGSAPCGDGYGTVSVSERGSVRLSGVLADGTRFTQSSGVSPEGRWPLYAPLYGRQGWLWGWLAFTNPPSGDLGGELSWVTPPGKGAKAFPQGFAWTTTARGCAYVKPQAGTRLVNCTNISVVLSGGALAPELSVGGWLGPGDRVRLGQNAKLSFAPSTGTFRGSALEPGARQRIRFGGVVLQAENLGCGCFLKQGTSGRVRLGPANETGFAVALQTLGRGFAPRVDTDPALLETLYWAWSDDTCSFDRPGVSKNFGAAAPRVQYLAAYPPDGVLAINLGFDRADGGEYTPLLLQPPQNVGAVYFPAPLPNLRCWASARNPITNTLDFTGFNSLAFIECYGCTNLEHAVIASLPSLRRACVEACALEELDISGDPNLEDLRAALNRYTSITVGGGTGPRIWHWCTRDNPQLTQPLQDILSTLFSLEVCDIWNDNQEGTLSFVSTNLMYVDAYQNRYSAADLSGHEGLVWCELYDNRLTNLVLTACPQLQVLDAHQNQLPPPVLDRLLEVLDTTGTHLVRVDLSQNAGPFSSAGVEHYLNLLGRGVEVRVDF